MSKIKRSEARRACLLAAQLLFDGTTDYCCVAFDCLVGDGRLARRNADALTDKLHKIYSGPFRNVLWPLQFFLRDEAERDPHRVAKAREKATEARIVALLLLPEFFPAR